MDWLEQGAIGGHWAPGVKGSSGVPAPVFTLSSLHSTGLEDPEILWFTSSWVSGTFASLSQQIWVHVQTLHVEIGGPGAFGPWFSAAGPPRTCLAQDPSKLRS